MLNQYTTIAEKVNGEIVEKKSKFIATIFPIESEEDALQKLETVRKQHRDARHHVFVYRIANGVERASDDGEPSGTAGVPILDILRGMKLQNILVVVTRYFGGILLGTGGLVRAYSDATKEALKLAKRVEKIWKAEYKIEISYPYYDKLLHYCRTNEIPIVKSEFTETILIHGIIEKEKAEKFCEEIGEMTDRTANITLQKEDYFVKKM